MGPCSYPKARTALGRAPSQAPSSRAFETGAETTAKRVDASVGDARCPSRAGTRRALRERGARQRYGGFDVRARVAVVQEHALHALHHFTRFIGGVSARTRALHERQKRLGRRHEHVRARRVDRYGAKKRVRERRARDAQRPEPRGPAFGPGARERRRGRDVERHAPALAGHHRAPARARGRGHARGLQERARQRELKHDRLAAALGRACGERGGATRQKAVSARARGGSGRGGRERTHEEGARSVEDEVHHLRLDGVEVLDVRERGPQRARQRRDRYALTTRANENGAVARGRRRGGTRVAGGMA